MIYYGIGMSHYMDIVRLLYTYMLRKQQSKFIDQRLY